MTGTSVRLDVVLEELLEAQAGSRALDARLAQALGWQVVPESAGIQLLDRAGKPRLKPGVYPPGLLTFDNWFRHVKLELPAATSSFEQALRWKPKSVRLSLVEEADDLWSCTLIGPGALRGVGSGPTLALALCVALVDLRITTLGARLENAA